MKQRGQPLTAAHVRSVKRPGRYGDGRGGHGLSLLVKPPKNGRLSRSWSQRIAIDGRVRMLGLGSYPAVTLAEARRRALRNARQVAEGFDPRKPPGGLSPASASISGRRGDVWHWPGTVPGLGMAIWNRTIRKQGDT